MDNYWSGLYNIFSVKSLTVSDIPCLFEELCSHEHILKEQSGISVW